MFGDKVLVGYSSTNIDEKNRLRLPKFTCADAGDKLVVVPDGKRLLIYSNDILEEYVDKIDKIQDTILKRIPVKVADLNKGLASLVKRNMGDILRGDIKIYEKNKTI